MDDFNWDDWDAQTAEYLNSSPTYQDYSWTPEQQDWLSYYNYEQPDMSIFMDPSAWEGYNMEGTGQESIPAEQPVSPDEQLSSWLNGSGLTLNAGEGVGGTWAGIPKGYDSFDLGTGLQMYGTAPDAMDAYEYAFGKDPAALSKFTSDFEKYLESQPGVDADGFDPRAMYRAADEYVDKMFAADDIRAPRLSPEYQAKFGVTGDGRQVTAPANSDAAAMLKQFLAKQMLEREKAKQAYANSGIGKALSGLSMAGAMYQALKGKNNAPRVEARGNQGVSFTPAYQGSSAPKTKYASGGEVLGGLPRMALEQLIRKAGHVKGNGGGQDDVVDIKAAPGEYVMDAEVVAALGDGNTDEGARKLDEMRVNIRKHKRQGGLSSIPPKAKKPEQYMKKGK